MKAPLCTKSSAYLYIAQSNCSSERLERMKLLGPANEIVYLLKVTLKKLTKPKCHGANSRTNMMMRESQIKDSNLACFVDRVSSCIIILYKQDETEISRFCCLKRKKICGRYSLCVEGNGIIDVTGGNFS